MKKAKRGKGCPTKLKLEADHIKGLLKDIEDGAFAIDAVKRAGVTKSSFCGWIRRGKEEKRGVYHEFYKAVSRARMKHLKAVAGSTRLSCQGGLLELYKGVLQEIVEAVRDPRERKSLAARIRKRFNSQARRKKKTG